MSANRNTYTAADLESPDRDITERLCQEFRVRDWWPGMDSFDSARGETVPHPLAREAADEIDVLRAVVRLATPDEADLLPIQAAAVRRALASNDI